MGGTPCSTESAPARAPASNVDVVDAVVAVYQNAGDDITAATESVAVVEERLGTRSREATHPAGDQTTEHDRERFTDLPSVPQRTTNE